MGKLRSVNLEVDAVSDRIYTYEDGMKDGFVTSLITVDNEDTNICLKGSVPFILYRNERYTLANPEIVGYVQILYSSNGANWIDLGVQEFKCVNHWLYDIHSFTVILENIPAGNIQFKYKFGVKKSLIGTVIRPVKMCINTTTFYPAGTVSGNSGFGDLITDAPPSRITPPCYCQFVIMQFDKNDTADNTLGNFSSVSRRISEMVPGVDMYYGMKTWFTVSNLCGRNATSTTTQNYVSSSSALTFYNDNGTTVRYAAIPKKIGSKVYADVGISFGNWSHDSAVANSGSTTGPHPSGLCAQIQYSVDGTTWYTYGYTAYVGALNKNVNGTGGPDTARSHRSRRFSIILDSLTVVNANNVHIKFIIFGASTAATPLTSMRNTSAYPPYAVRPNECNILWLEYL